MEADARRVLAAWRRSGLSAAAFAHEHGLNPQRLGWWRKRLAAWSAATRATTDSLVSLVPAEVRSSRGLDGVDGTTVVVRLPDEVAIEIASASSEWVAALVRALARPA